MNVPDVIAPGIRVLFVGVNPGIRSAQEAHHFAHPSGRLWKALHESGFTPVVIAPNEEARLLDYGLGLTNLVDRPTRLASELTATELGLGAQRLEELACAFAPAWVAVLGVVAYRLAFRAPRAEVGPQDQALCASRIWVLPGPTGRNAHYPLPQLIEEFRRLRQAVKDQDSRLSALPPSASGG